MKRLVLFICYKIKLHLLIRHFYRPYDLRIICYHSISDECDFLPEWLVIEPNEFANQLKILKKYFNIITFDDIDLIVNKKIKNPLMITFDDGLRDSYEIALPILKNLGLKAVFYLNTIYLKDENQVLWTHNLYILNKIMDFKKIVKYFGKQSETPINNMRDLFKYIKSKYNFEEVRKILDQLNKLNDLSFDNNLYIKEKEIKSLINNNMCIGSHGYSHFYLTKIDDIAEEINESKTLLEKISGTKIISFAYPFGDPGSFNEQINQKVYRDFSNICTTIPGVNTNDSTLYYRICSYKMSQQKLLFKLLLGI